MKLHRVMFAAVTLILGMGVSAFAQTRIQFVEYSAKFLCGTVEEKAGPLGPGVYETSINIHNPQLPVREAGVTFVKKAVLATPEGDKPVPPSKFQRDVLEADFAEHVDCRIIRHILGPAGAAPFIEGFVVLIVIPSPPATPHELDVTGVYTVNSLQGQSVSLEVVPVSSRIVALPGPAGAKMRDQLMK